MLVSINALKKYINLDGLSADTIAERLTFSGIEVEEVTSLASGTNLVIGQIISCVNHPDSDHLHILKVDLGEKYGVEQIVCGAPNARNCLKVIVARVGAILPQLMIKKGVIRGVESNGMCCSLLELGVNPKMLTEKETSGIEELPEDAPIGEENVLGYLGLDDEVLNIKVLANRPDLLSIYNIALEIGAIFDRKVIIPSTEDIADFKSDIKIDIETPYCTQFAIKEAQNIVVKESPEWLKDFLSSMGIRSINNLVDIGNYVMLLTGQPLHMYDADKLPKKELKVVSDIDMDVTALDEKTYHVINGDICITSDHKVMCIGGVMGSFDCMVDDKTTHCYIEAASFNAKNVRHTSSRLGLVSESSTRFVKGTNHFQSEQVLALTAHLLKELCEADFISGTSEIQKEEKKDIKIVSSISRINERLGTSFEPKEIKEVLERLYFKIHLSKDGKFVATVPPFRLDVTCDADLSEEVIRILGFASVKDELPRLDVTLGGLTLVQHRLRMLRDYLNDIGLSECLTYSLVSKEEASKFNLVNNEEHYEILNPLTNDHRVFRTHILHSLLKVANYNIARQNKDLALFETSILQSKESISTHLAIVLVGKESLRGSISYLPYDFYSMKGIVESLFSLVGIEKSRYRFTTLSTNKDYLHEGRSAEIIFQNKVIGYFGELHPKQVVDYDLGKTSAIVLEMNLDPLLNAKVSTVKMSPISRFPMVKRDLALIVDKSIPVSDIIRTIKVSGKGLVKEALVFDVYEGENILSNKKSVAISIYYGSDCTLNDKEINEAEDKIKAELGRVYKVDFRV